MNDALARLRALKSQAGSSKPLVKAPSVEHLGNPIEMLRRRMAQMSSRSASARSLHHDRELHGEEIADGLLLTDNHLNLDLDFPSVLDGTFDRSDGIAAEDVVFFDTETTGLSGGTGTRAFMIGIAQYQRNGAGRFDLRVRQLLTTTLGAEREMLSTFAGWLTTSTVFCSYNGKSYDAPLLKTRYRLARMGNPFADLRHVDLLYPTRRQYKGVYENCRLCTIEDRVLRISREDDLPGSEAPAAWLNYLRGGSAHNLRRVGEHNHQDVVTLSKLLLHLVEVQGQSLYSR